MAANSLNHVSVPASDLEQSIAFYVELLGPENCELIPSPNFGFDDLVPSCWLRVGDCQLHLFQADVPVAAKQYHFAIGATGIDQIHRVYLLGKERGFLDSEGFGHHIYEMPGGDVQLYVSDPFGNTVELDWRDASEVDETIVTDLKRIADRAEQSDENLRSTLFFDKLAGRGWEPSGPLEIDRSQG